MNFPYSDMYLTQVRLTYRSYLDGDATGMYLRVLTTAFMPYAGAIERRICIALSQSLRHI